MRVHAPRVVQVVAFLRQRILQPNVLEEPVAPRVVRAAPSHPPIVVAAVLQEHTERLLLVFPHDVRVRVAAAIAKVDEAADDAQNLAKIVRPLPRNGERRNRTGTGAADTVPLRIFREVVFLVEHGHQFIDDHARVSIVEGVVFGRPVRVAIAPVAWRRFRLLGCPAGIDENGDHHGNLAPVDQVVQHVRRAQAAFHVFEGLAVLKDHQTRGNGRIVLSGHIDPVGVLSSRICLARQHERTAHIPLRHPVVRLRVGAELVIRVHVRALRPAGRAAAIRRRCGHTTNAAIQCTFFMRISPSRLNP